MTSTAWWERPEHIEWVQLLLTSFHHWTGRALMERTGSAGQQANDMFYAPFIVLSHGAQADPIFNYGNRAALALWEMTWEELHRTPSRLTAEPANQAERARMLAKAQAHGYIADYRGVRLSRTGRRFLVEQALVWNVLNREGQSVGQAATFAHWKRLD